MWIQTEGDNPGCPYNLRSNIHTLTALTKKEEEESGKNERKCPPIPQKRSNSRLAPGAWPLGQCGRLSENYDPSSGASYLEQMFYEIDQIGQGSFGTVYRYRSLEDGHCYAIKVIKRYSTKDRFWEIRALDQVLTNPYCVQYKNAWIEKNLLYVQLDLGIMSVADYSRKNHDICEDECLDIVFDVLKALRLLHNDEWVHMDIKPDNIMISYDGKYKLCDFGLLTKSGGKGGRKSTVSVSEGDAKYVAKEVLAGEISTAADIFSLGITLIELHMDLVLPIYGPWWHELRECKWRLPSPKLSKKVSDYVVSLINWMMESNPKSRPTAEQLLRSPAMLQRSRAKKQRINHFADWCRSHEHLINKVTEVVTDRRTLSDLNSSITQPHQMDARSPFLNPIREDPYQVPALTDSTNSTSSFGFDFNYFLADSDDEIACNGSMEIAECINFQALTCNPDSEDRRPLSVLSPSNRHFGHVVKVLSLKVPSQCSDSCKGAARVLQLSPQPGPSNKY